MEPYKSPPLPENEENRLAALQEYEILDTLPEKSYDDIVKLAAVICDVPIALISLLDENRQWFKARVGSDVEETSRCHSFCSYAILSDQPLCVSDATKDERFANNPLVTGEPHIRFYGGVPLRDEHGHGLGTICVIDRKERELAPHQLEALGALSRQVMTLMEMAKQQRHLVQVLKENQKVQAELQGMNTVLSNSIEGISRLGADGRYVMANLRYAAACGYDPVEMEGMDWQLTVHPDERQRMAAVYANMLETASRVETETVGLRRDGSIFYKHIVMVPYYDEDGKLQGHYCFMRDITQRKIRERRLVRGAYHDSLTDLPNRASILESLDDAMARLRRRPDYCFAILFLDLDEFKPANDKYGHAAGDFVLKEVANRLRSCTRGGDIAARIGGDEFVILLDDLVRVDDAKEVADRIHEAMATPFFYENQFIEVGISIGIAISDPSMKTREELINRADEAMYKEKAARKNKEVPT